ncbi:MAG: chloride channel protein, partial [Bacteroidales bacterium]|nr:chloride channel protein [Bacteroidales bacterium]
MKFQSYINRLAIWKTKRISNQQFVLILSFFIGIFSGLAAIILKNTVHYTFYFITRGFQFEKENYFYLALPLIGIFLTVIYTKFILKKDISHGVSKILYGISKKTGKIDGHNTYSS